MLNVLVVIVKGRNIGPQPRKWVRLDAKLKSVKRFWLGNLRGGEIGCEPVEDTALKPAREGEIGVQVRREGVFRRRAECHLVVAALLQRNEQGIGGTFGIIIPAFVGIANAARQAEIAELQGRFAEKGVRIDSLPCVEGATGIPVHDRNKRIEFAGTIKKICACDPGERAGRRRKDTQFVREIVQVLIHVRAPDGSSTAVIVRLCQGGSILIGTGGLDVEAAELVPHLQFSGP